MSPPPSPSSPPRAPDFAHGSILLSWWFLALLVVLTIAFIALAVCVWIRPVRRRWRLTRRGVWVFGVGSAALAFMLAVATVADEVNRHFSYIPSFSALRGDYSPDLVPHQAVAQLIHHSSSAPAKLPAHGLVEDVWLSGPRSGIGRHGYVYLPRAYFQDSQRRFAVLYLLHGSPGVAADWLRGGFVDRAMDDLIEHQVIQPFIVVLPDVNGGYGRDTECQDIVHGPQVQTYLTFDVTAWIDQHYRTIAEPSARAIGGLSTGGYCALNLLLRHQDVFSAAIMHSGALHPTESRYSRNLWGRNEALRRANTPEDYLPTIAIQHPLAVYCDGGADDRDSVYTCIEAQFLLNHRHIPVAIHILRHEGHTFSAWRRNLYLSLPWLSDWFTATDTLHQ